jgi:hypothetical protein
MQNAAQYREYAEQCRQLAKSMKGQNKQTLLGIAEAWDKCAREIEAERPSSDRKPDGHGPGPEMR